MACHLLEDIWAALQLENLKDNEAILTCDFKMKILSFFFRVNQKKWFGKRGTTLLGFMITTNVTEEESKAEGLKEVTFAMMVIDDCLQDDWEGACAKMSCAKSAYQSASRSCSLCRMVLGVSSRS
jgi:hypothetical protein